MVGAVSSLRFAGSSYFRAAGTRDAFGRASDHMVREGFPAITITSGDREYATQVSIFLSRYVQAGDVRGRRVYDVRYWNGVAWYRISSAGTVAVPGTSNHESRRAGDLGYPYNNRNTAAHKRLQQIAHLYGLKWTGINFAEDWHWENVGALGVIGSPAGGEGTELEMPLNQQDLIAILNAEFATGTGKTVSIKQALGAVYFYGDLMNRLVTALPDEVWAHKLKHSLTGEMTSAGGLLRYEPAEHEVTRTVIANHTVDPAPVVAAVEAALANVPGVDLAAVRAAVVDGLDQALPALGEQVTAAAKAGIDGATIRASAG